MRYTTAYKQFQKEQFQQFCKWQECSFVMPDIGKRNDTGSILIL